MQRKFKNISLYITLLFTFLVGFYSCEDDLNFSEYDIPDGSGDMIATVSFSDLATTSLGGSRSSGTAIEAINDIFVGIYNTNGELYKSLYLTPDQWTPDNTTEKPGDAVDTSEGSNESWADHNDHKTPRASFTITDMPYGRYQLYVAANVGNLEKTHNEEIQTADGLKSISFSWQSNDIPANNQMFGYFTDADNKKSSGFDAPTIIFTPSHKNIHAWIKRLASKVTVAYDGSGLRQGIVVYIHNVSIRQIPLSCKLGEDNKPDAKNQITPAYFNQSVPDSAQALYYNNAGKIVAKNPYNYSGDNYKKWLEVANGAGIDNTGRVGSDHTYNAPALYFYENMQGTHPEKAQQKDQVGTNVAPSDELSKYPGYTDEDYQDDVIYGTFIEVEAYYQCDTIPTSNGPIRYRFMLGQNVTDNFDAARNRHYKLTLGFKGYANQPDWHIEYKVESPEIYAPEIYIPYTYNTSVQCPITFNGNLTALRAEIIENNWAPYDSTQVDEVPPASVGSTDLTSRTLEFNWARNVYLNETGYTKSVNNTLYNSANNYIYGRHPSGYFKLNDQGEETKEPYYVTPIWAGFLRLQVPDVYQDENIILPTVIVYNRTEEGGGYHYRSNNALTDFRNYYFGRDVKDADEKKAYGADGGKGNGYKSGTDLSSRVFNVSNPASDPTNKGRNFYSVKKGIDVSGEEYSIVTLNLWTQPKSMCGNSGFSGNNPYEDYNRRAVIRFYATFKDKNGVETEVKKDVTVFQSKRLVNPKAVWRSHDNDDDFNVTLMERNVKGTQNQFQPVRSRGEWRARIKGGNEDGFISLKAGLGSTNSGGEIIGKTLSEINFTIDFTEKIDYSESKCAIIEVTYHNNRCVHNIFVRQGYHQPLQIVNNGKYWSSYNLYSCDTLTTFETQTGEIASKLTANPLAFGSFFKRGNYARAISVSNILRNGNGKPKTSGFGPLQYPGSANKFDLVDRKATYIWEYISGNTDPTWHWANFKVTLNDGNNTQRVYTVPTISDFETLQSADFGVGVLYGDGASSPATTTNEAYGFLDGSNRPGGSKMGMRGFIVYNNDHTSTLYANQTFFPIGTSGIGRRTIQSVDNTDQSGELRYGALTGVFNTGGNSMRPIPCNYLNSPGSIYWAYTGAQVVAGTTTKYAVAWDMNYFDLNFTTATSDVVSISSGKGGGGGDALPIKLVTNNP